MLLHRDDSATAGTSIDTGSNSSGSGIDGDTDSSSTGSNSRSRRRRAPPGAAAVRKSADGVVSEPTVAAAGVTATAQTSTTVLDQIQPPFVLLGDSIHDSGGVMLAVYPKHPTPTSTAADSLAVASPTSELPTPTAPAAATGATEPRRLDAASYDSVARLVLGTDHLHHVVLRVSGGGRGGVRGVGVCDEVVRCIKVVASGKKEVPDVRQT